MSKKKRDKQAGQGEPGAVLEKQSAIKALRAGDRVTRPFEHIELDGHSLDSKFHACFRKDNKDENEAPENP